MIEEAQQSVMWVRSKSAWDLLETLEGRKSQLSVRPHWVDNRMPPYLLALYPSFSRVSPVIFMLACAHLPSSWGAHPVFFFWAKFHHFSLNKLRKSSLFFSGINSTNFAILGSNFTKIYQYPKKWGEKKLRPSSMYPPCIAIFSLHTIHVPCFSKKKKN
jgi:hypothetical protein